MRIPEPFFPLLNRVMRILLNSPLHGLMSGSVMVVYYTGRKTGKRRWTPVRYVREDGIVVCLTARETGWWPNFLGSCEVELQLAGRRVAARASAYPDDTERKTSVLRLVLQQFPGDAPYHGIVAKRGEEVSAADFEQAVARDVVVSFELRKSARSATGRSGQ
ncbi:MAG: nitroreductase family deazaflavin-dependent oxidoreductase [Pseudomonadales bacterium]|nr:nitroreductase family deazaflavin-dependent oxidoreductase [Pseudomonadales bacterium]